MPDILLDRPQRTITAFTETGPMGPMSTPMDIARRIQDHRAKQIEPLSFSIHDGCLSDGRTMIPFTSCPTDAVSAIQVVEQEELKRVKGQVFDVPVVEYRSLYAVYDAGGEPLGMIEISPNQEELSVLPADIALTRFGIRLPKDITLDDIQSYLRAGQEFFASSAELTMKSGVRFDALVSIETGLPFYKLMQRFGAYKDRIYDLVRMCKKDVLDTVSVIQNEDELRSLLTLAETPDKKRQYELRRFVRANRDIKRDLPHIPVASELERNTLYKHLDGLYNSFVRVTLGRVFQNDFDWEAVHASQLAFGKMLDEMYGIPQVSQTDLQPFQTLLNNFAQKHMHDPEGLLILLPALTASWYRYADSFSPGMFQNEARVFYETLGDYLDETASETTGDTTQELERMLAITKELKEKGFLGDHIRILDTGCRSGERLLRHYLTRLREDLKMSADSVVGVDLLQFPQPKDGLWQAVQADFSQDEFVEKVGGNFPLVLDTWSPLADISPRGQQRALNNFSRVGQIVVIDIPAGYLHEMEHYHARHPQEPFGVIEREFATIDGKITKKHFTINPLYEILSRATLAGFKVLNGPDGEIQSVPAFWETKNGKRRLTLVLKKVNEPQDSIDVLQSRKSA